MTTDRDGAANVERTSGPIRHIYDETGQLWIVSEVIDTREEGREVRSLVFVTDDRMRRVRNYPPDWEQWSDLELYALSLRY